tara:strand:- start:345 stop:734 length:390 start_codon:yes stop_codon:yes gene_type:complete
MKFYAHIDNNNQLIGWYNDETHETIPEPYIEVTEEQWANALDNDHNKINADGSSEIADFRTDEEKTIDVRYYRDFLLVNDVDPIVSNALRWADLPTSKQDEWKAYRQALLDVPAQSSFPDSVTWPTKPV